MTESESESDVDVDVDLDLDLDIESDHHRLPKSPALYIIQAIDTEAERMRWDKSMSFAGAVRSYYRMLLSDNLSGTVAYRVGSATDVSHDFDRLIPEEDMPE